MAISTRFSRSIRQPGRSKRICITVSLIFMIGTMMLSKHVFSGESNQAGVETTYRNNCAVCHGETGRGDGSAAYLVFPKPRDFTSGLFRFKSTPQSQPPTFDDVTRIITNGISRTAMPGFEGVLTENEIAELAKYVLSLNESAAGDLTSTPIEIPAKPAFNQQLINEGKTVYDTMGCAQCHGETGRGDGPSSWDLKDIDGYPLPPADYTTGVFKAGDTAEDLYRTILVGVPGTPMPSFSSAMEAGIEIDGIRAETDQIWAMTAYLESLAVERERPGIASGAVINVGHINRVQMLSRPFDRGWSKIESTPIAVQPLWQRKWSTRAVEIRVASNQTQLAICFEWPDETFDAIEGLARATDACAAMFSLTGDVIPMIPMGGIDDQGNAMTVNVWHWKASRQLDADESRRHDIETVRAGDPADLYMFKSGDPVQGPISEHDRTFITGWEAGNLNSNPNMIGRSVFESNAAGFGTLTLQPFDQQHVRGVGRYANGSWRVVMVRDLATDGDDDIALRNGRRVPIAFAIWDGAALDRDGTKLVSGWHFLKLDP